MSEPKSKMTLLLTPAERARLDELRLARGDRHASATLRALVRDAGGDPPPAPDARLTAALDLLAALPARAPAAPAGTFSPSSGPCPFCDHDEAGCLAKDPTKGLECTRPKGHTGLHVACAAAPHEVARSWAPAPRPAPDPPDTAEDDDADAYALLILEEVRRSAPAALVAELGDRLPPDPAAAVAALIVHAMPHWQGLDPGGDPPDPLRPAHVRGAARAARELADELDKLADRA